MQASWAAFDQHLTNVKEKIPQGTSLACLASLQKSPFLIPGLYAGSRTFAEEGGGGKNESEEEVEMHILWAKQLPSWGHCGEAREYKLWKTGGWVFHVCNYGESLKPFWVKTFQGEHSEIWFFLFSCNLSKGRGASGSWKPRESTTWAGVSPKKLSVGKEGLSDPFKRTGYKDLDQVSPKLSGLWQNYKVLMKQVSPGHRGDKDTRRNHSLKHLTCSFSKLE